MAVWQNRTKAIFSVYQKDSNPTTSPQLASLTIERSGFLTWTYYPAPNIWTNSHPLSRKHSGDVVFKGNADPDLSEYGFREYNWYLGTIAGFNLSNFEDRYKYFLNTCGLGNYDCYVIDPNTYSFIEVNKMLAFNSISVNSY